MQKRTHSVHIMHLHAPRTPPVRDPDLVPVCRMDSSTRRSFSLACTRVRTLVNSTAWSLCTTPTPVLLTWTHKHHSIARRDARMCTALHDRSDPHPQPECYCVRNPIRSCMRNGSSYPHELLGVCRPPACMPTLWHTHPARAPSNDFVWSWWFWKSTVFLAETPWRKW
jgi:hypothetical protein